MKMNDKDKAISKINKVIDELKKVLATNNVNVLSVSSPKQLLNFIKSFELALNKIVADNLPPRGERTLGMANLVADQWPFEIELGSLIIEAEKAYKNI